MNKKGAPKVLKDGVRLNIKIESSMDKALRIRAKKEVTTLSRLVRRILQRDLSRGK